jgi:hypothetical protein
VATDLVSGSDWEFDRWEGTSPAQDVVPADAAMGYTDEDIVSP